MIKRATIYAAHFLTAIILLPLFTLGQLSVTEGSLISMTPLQFVQTYLVGSGITVTNATFNGSAQPLNSSMRPTDTRDQIGNFTTAGGATTQLGIQGGVLLSSGEVQDAVAGGQQSFNTGAGSDPDLVILANGATINDKAVLEFDFIPGTDVVTFNYVFCSNEFDEFCFQYNDSFGLFLSGPGISGGLGFVNDAVNIALLPSSVQYVNINNICTKDENNLGMGVYSWWNADPRLFYSFDRMTYVFTASYNVQCNQTYHMKFAIGDALDGSLDSGVFLEQNSFASSNIVPATTFSNPQTGDLLIAGCSDVSLNYSIPQTRTTDLVIETIIHSSGTATQADILPNPFPAQVIIPAGQLSSAPIVIQALPAAPGPDKTLVIKATTYSCSIPFTVTNTFSIKYNAQLVAGAPPQTICTGNQATLSAVVTGGQPLVATGNYQYLWSTGATTSSITVSPPAGSNPFSVTVTDACSQVTTVSTSVSVGQVPPVPQAITGEDTLCTPVSGVVYSINPLPGADSYTWNVPAGVTVTAGSGTHTITVDVSAAALPGLISVFGHNNVCGDGPAQSLDLYIKPSVGTAGPVTGPGSLCTDGGLVAYSIPPLANATSYEWTVPAGVIIAAGATTPAIQCLFPSGATSGNISVRGYNADCGFGLPASLPVIVTLKPGQAGAITGQDTLCTPVNGLVYSVPPIPGADTYDWSLPPGSTIQSGANTNSITVGFSTSAASGTISVAGRSNICGPGDPSEFTIVAHPSPPAAGAITGPSTVCQGAAPVSYSITPLAFTTFYEWSVPSGVSILSGAGTNQISCLFTTSAVSGTISVRGFNSDCLYGASSQITVTVNPIPAPAGTIVSANGATVCQNQSGRIYSVPSIAFASAYSWNYSGTGVILSPNGNEITIDFLPGATSGVLMVTGQNSCGNGSSSAPFPVKVNPMPVVSFGLCGNSTTTKNGRPVRLRGGMPFGSGGVYSGPGVSEPAPGTFVFDPTSPMVTGGGTSNGIPHTIAYRYTNSYGCFDEKTASITVYASNAGNPCPGTIRDVRDDQVYPTFMAGTGVNQQCWMAANLNYGSYVSDKTPQTDNCEPEKYCLNNIVSGCAAGGGYYQWDELMDHAQGLQYQDMCPPGWHVPSSAEWDLLISASLGNALAGSVLKDLQGSNQFHGLLNGMYYLSSSWAFGASGTTQGSHFWTATATGAAQATARGLNVINPSVSLYPSGKANAFTVRCVRN